MGDHRASIKIEFTMHGVTTTGDMWLNWSGDDRPTHTTEIEVTPEMIEAGIEAMWEHHLDDFDRELWRAAMRAGYLAMRETLSGVPREPE